jgi:hypothetical protein
MGFLWFGLGLAIFSLLLSFIKVTTPSVYPLLESLDNFQTTIGFIARLITIAIFLVWMYCLHSDLNQLLKGYPITPRGALARLVIPFYNLWGIWNTFATLGDRLKSAGGDLASWGSALRSWLIGLYITGFASNALHHAIHRQSVSSTGEIVSPALSLLAVTADLFLSIVWLQMARIIRSAVNHRAKRRVV